MLIRQWSNLGVLATLEPCPLQTAYIHRGNSGCAWACAGRSTVSTAKKVATLVDSGGIRATLLGHNWLGQIKLDWHNINYVQSTSMDRNLESIFDKQSALFAPGLGTMHIPASIIMKPGTVPKFFKHKPVLYALREAVDEELNRLIDYNVKESLRRWL